MTRVSFVGYGYRVRVRASLAVNIASVKME